MKFFYIKRRSVVREIYRTRVGLLNSKVTSVTKYFLGIPIKKVHTYKQTYYGVKDNAIEKMLFI